MGCRFPGAADLDAFSNLLLEQRSAIGLMPAHRFDASRYYDPDVTAYGKSYCRIGACIDEHEVDFASLGLSEEEARAADTLHLWALEVAKSTLEHAGLDPFALRGENVGVILGHSRSSVRGSDLSFSTAVESLLADLDAIPSLRDLSPERRAQLREAVADAVHRQYPTPVSDRPLLYRSSEAAGLVSRTFGFSGRHFVADAACASSFAAIDVAVRALRQGRLRLALAGGASYTSPSAMVLFSQAKALSSDGSFPFDARANGFVCSEGVGMVLLARLDDALEHGYTIHGLIHGIGASSDGRGKGLWAPNKKGQVMALKSAYAKCGVDPAAVSYVEAHGTSTALGDATEVESLTEFFAPHVPIGREVAIGSVKSNIGHCREAAGIASLLKVLIAFEHETIPASINYRDPNPHIDWESSRLRLATEPLPWPRNGTPRMAGLDSFGIGGLNYHVILEEPPGPSRVEELTRAGITAASNALASGGDPTREPIALVGIGCIWPEARGANAFWDRLRSGQTAIGPVPESRLPAAIYSRPGERAPWRTYTNQGGFIAGFAADWRRYRMPPKLVAHTDPLQLMLLECALDALADAGLDTETMDRRRISTTVGTIFGSDHGFEIELALRAPEAADAIKAVLTAQGFEPEVVTRAAAEVLAEWRHRLPEITEDTSGNATASPLASRIAMTLDLHGATFAVDAGPASSLAALEIAAESLWSGESDVALWAGADRGLSIPRFVDAARLGRLSQSGQSAPFDADADGVVLSEGTAVGVLMRLSDAQKSGRRVYAVIRGLGSAGPVTPLEAPATGSELGTAITRAHAPAHLPQESISYIEALGAGTRRSDDALIDVARAAFCSDQRQTPVLMGSVVGNIGHAQGASGAAAVVKTALALHHGEVPPTPGVRVVNPGLTHGLEACLATRPFPEVAGVMRGAVSAQFEHGLSYHVILEGAARPAPVAREPVVIRAASRAALGRALAAAAVADELSFTPGSVHGTGSVAAGVRSGAGIRARFGAAQKALASPSSSVVLAASGICVTDFTLPGETCFLFSGQGSQYPGMLREVARAYPAAAARLAEVDAELVRCGEVPLSEIMWERTERLNDVLWTQMAVLGGDLMMLEVARAHGLVPQLITGHSYGDYPALVAAGGWTLEQVVQMTVLRCESILKVDLPGGMVAVFGSRADVASLLVGLPGYAAESNINAPDEVIVSGEPAALDVLLEKCQAVGITAKRLPVPRAFHSELMRPAVPVVEGAIRDTPFQTPVLPFMTSAGAKVISSADDLRRALVEQFTRPVDFIAQIEAAYASGCRRFVEIGPGKVLSRLATRILAGRPAVAVSLDDKKMAGLDAIESALAVLRAHDHATMSAHAGPEGPAYEDRADHGPSQKAGEILFFDVTTSRKAVDRSVVPHAPAGPGRVRRDAPLQREDVDRAAPIPAVVSAPISDSRVAIESRVVDLVCESSGYPRDLVSLDSDLEADLGIDTVKQAQILGRIREHYDLPTDESLAIREVPTPRHIADYVERASARVVSPPPVAEEPSPLASKRVIIRTVEEPRRAGSSAPYRPERVVVVGGAAIARALVTALEKRGVVVERLDLDEEPGRLESKFDDLMAHGPVPDICLLSGVTRDASSRESRESLLSTLAQDSQRLLEAPLRLLQSWVRHAESDLTRVHTLFAVTALGGALGHANAADGLPEGGGVLGLCKNLRREFPGLRIKVLDSEVDEQPDIVAGAMLEELDSDDPRLEVGYLRGKRLVLSLVPLAPRIDPDRLTSLGDLPYVVLTGGGRGITAEIALQLARAGVRRVHLLGRTHLPADVVEWRELDAAGLEALRTSVLEQLRTAALARRGTGTVTPSEWDQAWAPLAQAIEIDRNLQRLAAEGAHATYHSVDIADSLALAGVLETIREVDGPVRAIVHGAGVQHSRGFLSKQPDEVRATLAPKLEGTLNLIDLTAADPLEFFVSFGSVAGRFGGLGQADYSMACDLLARITGAFAARRPSCRMVTIDWPGWDEVGMAARTRHLFESGAESKVRRLMPVAEGCQHLINELTAADPETEVVVGTALEGLDLDRQISRGAEADLLEARIEAGTGLPLVDAVLAASARSVTVECRLDADRDPFLVQHRHARTAILPAVVSLELLAEAARLAHPDEELHSLENVVIGAGIKLAEIRRLPLICTAEITDRQACLAIRGHHVGRQSRLLAMDRIYVTGKAIFGHDVARRDVAFHHERPTAVLPPHGRPYANGHPGSLAPAGWYHGPVFRTLEDVVIGTGALHSGRVLALPATALRPWRASAEWWIPAPALDGCLAMCVQVVRAKLLADGLPVAFGRVRVRRQPASGEVCEVFVRERGHDERRVHFDFTLTGADGSVIFEVEDYVLRTFHRIGDGRDEPREVRKTRGSEPDALWTTS